MSNAEEFDDVESIAIVGMAGRFPGAGNVAELWQNLCRGVESITFLTDEELTASGVEAAVFNHPNYVKAKPVLDRMEMFDASFFGYTPREAELMDPQHRIFLESAWAALEDAGYDADRYDGKIGVFAGASLSTYLINAWQSLDDANSLGSLQQLGIGNGLSTFATRVSYKLNLRGPSVSVQTACSTSLAAVHLAAQSLLNYQCDMALAGGVSIIIPNREGYHYQEGAIFSPDGHCRTFDAKAKGTIVGDGVGIIVLKRLSEAVADGDFIHAVIKGSAMNNDGSQKVGFTAPSVDGQVEVIAEAQAVAGVSPETISYVEAHGTATPMGDPIEVRALTKAFRTGTERKQFCAIGSIKSNIGHLDTAAGVAGLIKTALALRHRKLPPTLHYEQPNPEIDFANSPFYVNTELAAWESDAQARRAGVSSFGFGGTNVHVVLEEAPPTPQKTSAPARPYQILALSAKTVDALDAAQENLLAHLVEHPELNLADIAYTYLVGRKAFDERCFVVCRDREDALSALRGDEPQRIQSATVAENRDRPVVFMFPGQGAQHVNMALELYRSEPTFRQHVDDCAAILTRHLGVDLRSIIFPREAEVEHATQQLNQTQLTQPALFVIEYALARLWMEWGVEPQAMIGHSIGEYVAACLAGVFSLEDGLALVAARGRLLQKLPGGSMLAVSLPEQELRPLIAGRRLAVAAHNAPSLCVVAGTHGEVAAFERLLIDKAVTTRRLYTSHAFHSEMVEPAVKEFTAFVSRLELNSPRLPVLSNVTGTWLTAEQATDPAYWAKHLRQTVRFAEGVQELLKEPQRILLEVGPGQTLSRLARQQPGGAKSLVLASLRHPDAEQPDAADFYGTLAKLWLAGVKINWTQFYANETRRRLPLPTYPFEGQRYWIDAQPQEARRPQLEAVKRPKVADWLYTPVWKQSVPLLSPNEANASDTGDRWLICADECGIGARLAETLRREGREVILLKRGAQFTPDADGSYTINPQEAEDYRKLIRSLGEAGSLPRKIVHLWSVSGNEGALDGMASFNEAQTHGVYSLLYLAQAIGERTLSERIEIFVIANNLQSVTGEESLCPEKATLLGLCKVVPQEYLNLSCRTIDILLPAPGTKREAVLIEQLLAECRLKSTDTEIAFRGDFRWVQTFESIETSSDPAHHARLKTGGAYLVIGGLSSIGLTLAETLARSVKARLVLTQNEDFPEREAWDAWTSEHGETDSVSRRIRHVQEIEKLGATVLIVKAGSRRLADLCSVVNLALEQFGVIDGVIYAERASIPDEDMVRTIQELEIADCERQFADRAQALYGLEEALQGVEPDFVLFISSISSTLGGIGLGAYTATNLFIDAFARSYAGKTATRCVSVNLDSWQTAEEKERLQSANIGASLSEMSISPQEGVEVFARLFSNLNAPQVIVSTGDLQSRVNQWVKRLSPGKHAQRERSAGAKHIARSKAMNSYVAPRSELEQTIAAVWQEVLGHAEIGVEDNFFELGGDSLLATQLVSRLRDALQAEISLRKFFESATIAGLAAILETAAEPSAQHKATKIKPIARDSIRVSRASLAAATTTTPRLSSNTET